MLKDALHEFQRVRDKYQHLKEFAKVSEQIDLIACEIEPAEEAA